MNTLRGISIVSLRESFSYDHEKGEFLSKKTGNIVGSYVNGAVYISKRVGHNVVALKATQVAWLLYYGEIPDSSDIVVKDDNPLNLKIDNLKCIPKGTNRQNSPKTEKFLVDTKYDGIKYHRVRGVFVVQRGKKSHPYWANSLEEALAVKKEWENNPKKVRFDSFHAKMPYYEKIIV